MKKTSTQSGFTVMELLIVFSIIALIVTLLIFSFRDYARFQQFNQITQEVEFVLNQARLKARSAVDDTDYGVKIDANNLIYFSDDSFVSGDPDNQIINYQFVTLTPNLSAGVDEIIFKKITALPSATGTILINASDGTWSKTVEISATGVIQSY